MWFGIPISFKNCPHVVIHAVRGLSIVNQAKVDFFLKLPYFLHDPVNVGNFISGSSASSKPSLDIRKFSVQFSYCWLYGYHSVFLVAY